LAIDGGRDVRFRYTDAKGDVTHRTIRPHRFVEFEFTHGEGRSLCVEGHCRLRDESRTFALRRMSEFEILWRAAVMANGSST
jgi:predicted DNA-binding transcriptional regulator YafY